MRSAHALPRRTFLRGVLRGAAASVPVALGLPCLDAMLNEHGDAYAADGAPLLQRCGVWFFGAGAHREWTPAATGPLELPRGLTPLERHKARITLVSGLGFASFGDFATNRHNMGASSVLTGTPPRNGAPGGASIDQLVARHLDKGLRASLELSVTDTGVISYAGAGSPNRPFNDPRKGLQSLFGLAPGGGTAAPADAPDSELRALYLDAVRADAAALGPKLGARDRQRLEGYVDGIRELEKEIAALGAAAKKTAACAPKGDVAAGITDSVISKRGDNFTLVSQAMSKLLAAALACGHTQVFTFNFNSPNSTPFFRLSPGLANNHHELGHQMHADLPRSVEYVMGRLAETLDALAAYSEGAGTVLDSTALMVTSEVARNHDAHNMPILLVGGPGTGLKGGQHVKASGATTKASFTLARAVGAPLTSFGTGEAKATEVLSGVLA
jgi:hypothetical protein